MTARNREGKRRFEKPRAPCGFTLIELLVSVAVMALLLVLLLQMVGSVLSATRTSRQEMNASRSCRAVLDALGNDLANAVTQNGAAIFVRSGSDNNTRLVLLTNGREPTTTVTGVCRWNAVSYTLSGNQIIRAVAPVAWSQTDLAGAAMAAVSSPVHSSVIASNVIRFEAAVVLDSPSNEASLMPVTQGGSWLKQTSAGDGEFSALVLSDPMTVSTTPRVRSIVGAVAAVDHQGMRLLNDQGKLPDFIAALSASNPGQTPIEVWNQRISAGLGAFPSPVLASLQTSQRVYPLK